MPPADSERDFFLLTFAEDDEPWRTLWLGLSSASSNTIRGFRLCTKRTLSGLALKSEQKRFEHNHVSLWRCFSHLWSLWFFLLLLDKPWPQARGEALWKWVTILACHDQVKGCAELGERERSISVHIAQLPDEWSGRTRLRICKTRHFRTPIPFI